MRLMDFQMSIFRRFCALPYPVYLCSMTVMLSELRESYRPFFSDRGLSLSAQTVDVSRLAAQPEGGVGEMAMRLMQEWGQLLDDPEEDGPKGWFSLTHTFEAFAGEMAGEWPPYAAAEYVTDAAAQLPVEAVTVSGPGQLVKIDFNEELDEDSPGGQMLRKFVSVIRFAEEKAGSGEPCQMMSSGQLYSARPEISIPGRAKAGNLGPRVADWRVALSWTGDGGCVDASRPAWARPGRAGPEGAACSRARGPVLAQVLVSPSAEDTADVAAARLPSPSAGCRRRIPGSSSPASPDRLILYHECLLSRRCRSS